MSVWLAVMPAGADHLYGLSTWVVSAKTGALAESGVLDRRRLASLQ